MESYALHTTLSTPAHISSLTFGHAGHLFAGSDDGSLRVYDLSSFKVLKAVRGLGSEVSSIICIKKQGSELRDAWIAHGRKVSKFRLDSPKMILDSSDALVSLEITTAEDVLNELALNTNKSHIAFTLDSGVVGVIDLATNEVTNLEEKHEAVCGSVKFIPERPRELVSGGYDTRLIHWDLAQGKPVSTRQIDPYVVEGPTALCPPFIMSLAMSSTGIVAAGTADGRLLIGFGGEKVAAAPVADGSTPASASTKKSTKKKGKKWEGLDVKESLTIKIAEGPIVALAFVDPRKLITSTLMGVLTYYNIIYEISEESVVLQQIWQQESNGLEKVNALVVDDRRIIVGGFDKKDKGVIEVWRQEAPEANGVKKPEQDSS